MDCHTLCEAVSERSRKQIGPKEKKTEHRSEATEEVTGQAKSVLKQKASVKEASNTELQSPLAEGWKPTVPPTGCDYGSLKPVTQLRIRWGEAVTSQA